MSAEPTARNGTVRTIGTSPERLRTAGSTVANTDSHTACGRGFPLCNGTLFPSLDHQVTINLTHRIWALAVLVLALWALFRSRRDRASLPPIRWAAAVVTILYLIQAGVGIAVLGLGENTAVEVLHSSIGSLTWIALATLLSLTRTLATEQRTNRSQR